MSNYVASLDFGTSKIALAVGQMTENGVRIVSYNDAESVGIKCGEIVKELQVIEAIKELRQKAEQDIGEQLEEVIIGVSGKVIHNNEISCKVLRSNKDSYVTKEELGAITKARYNSVLENGEVVFEVVPQRYNIDDNIGFGHDDLIGMKGQTIDATFKLFFGKESIISRRREIVEACGLKVKKAILAPIASARAVLTSQEMENGAALVDIGKGVTEIAIVKDNIVKNVYTIPFAGEAVSNDIKMVTNTTAKWAEAIKVLHGSACSDFTPENKKLVLRGAENSNDGEVDLSLLSSVIEARLSEIFDAVKYVIDHSDEGNKLSAGVVLTGGTCYTENIQQLASALLGQKVRIAAPRGAVTADSVETAFDAYSSTAVGLILEGCEGQLSHAIENNSIRIKVDAPAPVEQEPEIEDKPAGGIFEDNEPREDDAEFKRRKKEEEKERKRAEEERKHQEREARKRAEEERKRREREEKEARKKEKGNGFWGTLFSENNDNA